MKYQSHFNYKAEIPVISYGISCTVGGQAYSVKDALNRIQKGLPVNGRNYQYQEDGETEPPMKLNDLTDIDRAKATINKINQDKEKAINAYKKRKSEEAAEAAKKALAAMPDDTQKND